MKCTAEQRAAVRKKWAAIRMQRKKCKDELIEIGVDIAQIRKDPLYRSLKKQQKNLSVTLRHCEKKNNRSNARKKNLQ